MSSNAFVQNALQVIIRLDDVNDNAPTFLREEFSIQTPDQRDRNRILGAVSATDPDLGDNGRVEYSMVQGDPSEYTMLSFCLLATDTRGFAK